MTTDDAKDYLYGKDIPKIFECILGGIMHHQPGRPVSFFRDCLLEMKHSGGVDNLRWNTFIDQAPKQAKGSQLEELRAAWLAEHQEGTSISAIVAASSFEANKHVRPVICLVGADQTMVRDTATLLTKNYNFVVRHMSQEARIQDVTACADVLANWISLINRQYGGCSGFLLTDFPPSKSHLSAFFKKKLVPGHLFIIVHLKAKVYPPAPLDSLLKRIRLSGQAGIQLVEFEVSSAEAACEQAIATIAERFRLHPSPSRLHATGLDITTKPALTAATTVASDNIISIKGANLNVNSARKPDLNPSVPLILLFVGPESKDYVNHLQSLPNIQCHSQHPNDSDAKTHQQILAELIIAGEDTGVVCVNFPRNENQLNWLLTRVGGLSAAVLVDYPEEKMRDRVNLGGSTVNATAIRYYKEQTMPTIHWLDRSGKLKLICQIENPDDEAAAFKSVESFILAQIAEKGQKNSDNNESNMADDANKQPAPAVTSSPGEEPAIETASDNSDNKKASEQQITQLSPPPSILSKDTETQGDEQTVESVAAATVEAVLQSASTELNKPDVQELSSEIEKRDDEAVTEPSNESQAEPVAAIEEEVIPKASISNTGDTDNPNPAYSAELDSTAEPDIIPRLSKLTGEGDNPNPAYSAELDATQPSETVVEETVVAAETASNTTAEPNATQPSEEVVAEIEVIAAQTASNTGEGENPNPAYSAELDAPPTSGEEKAASAVINEVIIEAQTTISSTGHSDNPNPDYSAELDQTANAPVDSDDDTEKLKKTKVVFVLGGPGSGKGTQCAKMVEKYGFAHLSTGDLLRDEVKSGSERGKKLEATMAAGELVTLDTVLELLRDSMLSACAKGSAPGFLIDGFPRELDQAIRFEKDIRCPDACLFFDLSESTMRSRLLKRGETSGRVDDNEETIIKRFHTFEQHSRPVVDHYAPSGKLHKINAECTPDEIFKVVEAAIDPIMKK